MRELRLRLPDALHQAAREAASREKISLNQLITLALAEKLSAWATEDYLKGRAAKASRSAFEQVLAQVPDILPVPEDRL